MEPLLGYGFKRWISSVLVRGDSLASARRTRSRLRLLRLRHPAEPDGPICLRIADQGSESLAGLRGERLASLRNGVLAQRCAVFGIEHALFGQRKRDRAGQRAAVCECRSRRAALRTPSDSGTDRKSTRLNS